MYIHDGTGQYQKKWLFIQQNQIEQLVMVKKVIRKNNVCAEVSSSLRQPIVYTEKQKCLSM